MFKFITQYFRNTRSTVVNVAQIILVALITMIMFVMLYLLSPSSSQSTSLDLFLSFLEQIPLFDPAIGIIKNYIYMKSENPNVFEVTTLLILKEIPDTLFVGVVCHVCNTIFLTPWDMVNAKRRGPRVRVMPIFSTFIGIVICTFILKLFGSLGNVISIVAEFGVIIVIIIGIKIMFKSSFGGSLFSLNKILTFIIDAIYAVILICFVATIVAVSLATPKLAFTEAFIYVVISLTASLIASVIVTYIRSN